jgi:RNA 2',3'-cyclic 3'-phosphodiesterase
MRLFIGIALAANATNALMRVREKFATIGNDLRWSAPESWHVTLQFLGSTSQEQMACVGARLAQLHAAPVPIRLLGLGFFDRAGVFYAGVDQTRELLALQQSVVAATRPCGFSPEARAYHPHITLARSKGRNGARALALLKRAVEQGGITLRAEFTAAEFLLYESIPGPEGSRYEVRMTFELGQAGSGMTLSFPSSSA